MDPILNRDIFDYRFISRLSLSPSGEKAAAVITNMNEKENRYESNLYLIDKEESYRLTGDDRISSYIWKDNETIIFTTVRTEEEKNEKGPNTNFYSLKLGKGEAEKLFSLPLFVSSFRYAGDDRMIISAAVDALHPDYHLLKEEERKKALDEIQKEKDYQVIDELPWWFNGAGFVNKKRTGIFILDLRDRSLKRITPPLTSAGPFNICDDKIVFTGSEIAGMHPDKDDLYIYDMASGETKTYLKGKFSFHSPVFPVDGKLLFAASECRRYGLNENPFFYTYDPDKDELKVINESDMPMDNSVLSDCSYGSTRGMKLAKGKVYFLTTVFHHAEMKCIGLDGKIETVYTSKGSVIDFDIEGDRIIYTAFEDMKLLEVYELKNGKGEKMTSFNDDALKDKYVAVPRPLNVMSEGLEIEGFVLIPKDYEEGRKYPAVLDIHGGPKCAYGEVFFHEMQAWASKGYFVFFCNPYGGDGRGNEFAHMADKYGTTDYVNLMDFTDKVLETYPAIDPSRLFVTGGSYGGYMTNWIVTQTSRFRAAATQRSISNWISMYGISDIGIRFTKDQNDADFFTDEGIEKMWKHSPLKYVRNVKTPLLFIHSDEDYRCPIAEGYQFYSALMDLGVPSRMCIFHGENHELSRGGKPLHRLRRLDEILGWFEKYDVK